MTIQKKSDQFVWCEAYRPSTIDDLILPEVTKHTLSGYVAQGRVPNLLFSGGAGVGKTTAAIALCNEVGCDWIIINASSENSIDVIRTKVTQFASTSSFSEAKKVIILDESDHITPNAQAALRHMIEAFSSNCTFILTCNFPKRLIEPIHSRCGLVDFRISNTERPTMAAAFFKRVKLILDNENVEYNKKVVTEVVMKFFPDFRRCLNELQRYAANGSIDSGILVNMDNESFKTLVASLKAKKWMDMRRWVANNSDIDVTQFFRMFYDNAVDLVQPKSLPELILLLGQYQISSSQVADQEINTAAFLTEILVSSIEFK